MVQVEQQHHEGDRQDKTRHPVYRTVLWKCVICEEQTKRPIIVCVQFPKYVLCLGLEPCFLWQNRKVVILPILILKTRTALVHNRYT